MGPPVWRSAWVGLIVSMMCVAGCASPRTSVPLPPAKMLQAADLASLACEWQGTWRASRGSSPAGAGLFLSGSVTFAPDGRIRPMSAAFQGSGGRASRMARLSS